MLGQLHTGIEQINKPEMKGLYLEPTVAWLLTDTIETHSTRCLIIVSKDNNMSKNQPDYENNTLAVLMYLF